MNDLWIWISQTKGAVILAGAAGGVVRTITLRERWTRAIANALVGALCALFLTPLTDPLLAPTLGVIVPDPSSVAGFSGFIIGLGGITISGLILDIIERRRADVSKDGDDA